MSDREEKTGKNDNGKKNKGGKRNKIVAIEMIILVLLIMAAVAIFIQRDKSVKEAAKIHNLLSMHRQLRRLLFQEDCVRMRVRFPEEHHIQRENQ